MSNWTTKNNISQQAVLRVGEQCTRRAEGGIETAITHYDMINKKLLKKGSGASWLIRWIVILIFKK